MPPLPPSTASSFLLLLFLLLSLPLTEALPRSASSPVSGAYDCDAHVPTPPPTPGCLSRLSDPRYTPDYEPCRDSSNTTCYVFLQEPPFVKLDPDVFNNSTDAIRHQRPFPCQDHAKHFPSLHGIAFELHKRTSSRDALCMWGGHSSFCTFNALVDYTQYMAAQGYRFAVTGLLLETPARQCHHRAAAPFVDNSVIIIGRKTPDRATTRGALHQLTRPFAWQSWAIFGALILLFIVVCVTIAFRFHVFRGRSMITAFFIFTGERDEALAHEMYLHGNSRHNAKQVLSFATKYGLSITLYRLALLAFIGVFLLFYEVAVVNFLFQQQSLSLTQSVKSLTRLELEEYAVLKNSALENVWAATVSNKDVTYGSGDDPNVPWQQCDTATQCIRWAAGEEPPKDPNKPVKFVVTFEVVGKYLLKEHSDCEALTIFETKDVLYQFNGGWLNNDEVEEEARKRVDRELVALRISGMTRDLIDEEIGDFSCRNAVKSDIGPMIILVPCLVFVLPPLLLSIVVLLIWKRARNRARNVPDRALGDSSEQGDKGSTWSLV